MGDSPLPRPLSLRFEPVSLYTVGQITAATFFATPLAGAWLMRWNFLKLGNPSAARTSPIVGAFVTALLIVLGFVLPDKFPRFVLAIVPLFAIRSIARAQFGEAIARHVDEGGEILSSWRVVKVCGATILATIALSTGLVYSAELLRVGEPERMQFGGGNEVVYTGDATESQARRLGEFLQGQSYFQGDRPATVKLEVADGRAVVSFVFGHSWASDSTVELMNRLGAKLTVDALGVVLTTILLVDPQMTVKHSIRAPFTPPSPLVDSILAALSTGDAARRREVLASLTDAAFTAGAMSATDLDRLIDKIVPATANPSDDETIAYAKEVLLHVLRPDGDLSPLLRFAATHPGATGNAFAVLRRFTQAPPRATQQAVLALATEPMLTDEIAFTALTWADNDWMNTEDLAAQTDALIARYRVIDQTLVNARAMRADHPDRPGAVEWAEERARVYQALFRQLPAERVRGVIDPAHSPR